MSTRRAFVGLLGSTLVSPVAAAQQANPFPLEVRLTGLRNDRGRVAVALFNRAKGFPKQDRALQGRVTPVRERTARVTFEGLTPGRYALAVLHDENENDEMDFNWLGMPKEGFGFSRDAKVLFGPPSFEDAALDLSSSASTVIRVRYFRL